MTEHTNDLAAIEALATAAATGDVKEWRVAVGSATPAPIMFDENPGEGVVYVDQAALDEDPTWVHVAEHIAGMDPAATLALVAEVRDLRAKIARVEKLAAHLDERGNRLCTKYATSEPQPGRHWGRGAGYRFAAREIIGQIEDAEPDDEYEEVTA